jgi:hypothetical protein
LEPVYVPAFAIRSVDVMKMSQDAVCGPPAQSIITGMTEKIAALGATHLAISTPYDDPACGSSLSLTRAWVNAARAHGLKVWFRQKPLAFEGFYGYSKNLDPAYHLTVMRNYILANPGFYRSGDILTPAPEPQNGGIQGINCFSTCLFTNAATFNVWLRESIQVARDTLAEAGISGVTVGWFGFDGFVAWGDRNPDWNGIIEPATIVADNNTITVDHYFPASADPAAEFAKIRAHFGGGVRLCLGEWGAINGESAARVRQVLDAAQAAGIDCINWWHAGPGGVGESLLQESSTGTVVTEPLYDVVREFYGGN